MRCAARQRQGADLFAPLFAYSLEQLPDPLALFLQVVIHVHLKHAIYYVFCALLCDQRRLWLYSQNAWNEARHLRESCGSGQQEQGIR